MTEEQESAIWEYVDRKVTVTHRAGRSTQELCSFTRGFFCRFGAAAIPRVLDDWRLPERIRLSHDSRVIVTADGVRHPYELKSTRQ